MVLKDNKIPFNILIMDNVVLPYLLHVQDFLWSKYHNLILLNSISHP